jgi:RNA polymerase sigma-70 factor, ECF subfamily
VVRHEDALDLVAQCADGDDDAWVELLRQYGRFLDYIIRRALAGAGGGKLPSPDEVEDVRGEVVAWLAQDEGRVLRTYRGESKLTSWLGVIVGRRARRIARRGAGLRAKTVSLDALTADATSHLAVEDHNPLAGDGRGRALGELTAALEELSERDRALLKGAFYEQKSYAELADEIGVRTDSVGQLLFRAKSRLKKRLGDGFLENLSGWALLVLYFVVRDT